MQQTVAELILDACERYRDKIAYTCLGADLSYADLAHHSACFQAWLEDHSGLQPGDRIAIQMPNLLQYPVAVLGALRAGLVVVNTNPLYSPRELEHQLRDSGAKALVVLANTATSAAQVVADTEVQHVIVTELADLHPWPRRPLINGVVKHVKKMVPDLDLPRAITWRQVLRQGKAGLAQPRQASVRHQLAEHPDLALLQYTGGTTGVAKGAMLTNHNLVTNAAQLASRLTSDLPQPGEIMAAPLPLYHIYAFTISLVFSLHKGIHSILIPNPRDLPAFVKAIKPYRLTGFVGINTLYNALTMNKAFQSLDFSGLKLSSSGGMALSTRTYQRWLDLTGCPITEGYGLTEASPLVSCNCATDFQPGTIGLPVPETEIKIIDEEGQAVADGLPGQLCVRGPQVMVGYWHNPEESEKVLDSEGWLRTGDIAVRQADGYLRIVDRLKDMIIVTGYNVFPNEIEDYVCQHPGVKEAAAIGVQRGQNGEKVKLFVVPAQQGLEKSEIIAHCEKGLAPYKVPRLVEFCESLPKTNVGKVLRRVLREQQEDRKSPE